MLKILIDRKEKIKLMCYSKDINKSGFISKIDFIDILKQYNIDINLDMLNSIILCIRGLNNG